MEKTVWKITGMHCSSCSELIKDILRDNGIEASLDQKTGRLAFSSQGSLEKIRKEIEKEGYGVSPWK